MLSEYTKHRYIYLVYGWELLAGANHIGISGMPIKRNAPLILGLGVLIGTYGGIATGISYGLVSPYMIASFISSDKPEENILSITTKELCWKKT